MNKPSSVPFVDLVAPHMELEEELVAVFRSVIRSAGFVGGPMVEAFEREFAKYCNSRFCVGVNSGTDAIRFALMALGVREGHAVITVANTFIATSEAISQTGALPIFIDANESTYTMDPEKLRFLIERDCTFDPSQKKLIHKKSGKQVFAVVPVHLYGQTADMDPILELAEKYNLIILEDACQAHGAEYFSKRHGGWVKAGSMGHAAAFSFYPGKNLGACGEGGAVTTNDEAAAAKMRMIREHGSLKKYYHEMEGYNGRLHSLQAGLLSVKLPHLASWTEKRRALAHRYHELLAVAKEHVVLPIEPRWAKNVYHLYVIRVKDRVALQAHLTAAGIGTGIHYPIPLHMQKAYENYGYREGDFPVSEKCAPEILSLPMFPQMTREQQDQVVNAILGHLRIELQPEQSGNSTARVHSR